MVAWVIFCSSFSCCSKIAEAEAAVSVNEKKWLVMHMHIVSHVVRQLAVQLYQLLVVWGQGSCCCLGWRKPHPSAQASFEAFQEDVENSLCNARHGSGIQCNVLQLPLLKHSWCVHYGTCSICATTPLYLPCNMTCCLVQQHWYLGAGS